MTMDMRARSIATGLLPALLPALLLVSGCAGTQNRGLESVHQPVVSRTSYAFDVTTTPDGLAPGERQRLAGWMASLRVGYGDSIAVESADGDGGAIRDTVAAETARYGLLLANDVPLTDTPVPPGTARIVVTRMSAKVPGCPDFSRVRSPEFESNTSSNQGCAVNSNIAAMVANPGDLVHGQVTRPITDQATSNRAIDAYRKAVPTGNGGITILTESTGGGSKK
ncbi:pilus assembly protein CpaD [Sphingomonas sp. PvP055]|uniref:CpaD family pilus assembly protein n=1 Tax=Sphingomonas sp. PvP055 TaxID=3156391 RepID=UPI003394E451